MNLYRRLARGSTLWSGLFYVLAFWAVVPFIPNNSQAEWLRIAQIVGSATVIAGFFTALFAIFREGEDASALSQRYVLGTLLTECGICGGASWLLLWRIAGMPIWMVQSELNSFWLWLICLGSYYKIRSIRRGTREPPESGWWRVIFVVVATAVIGTVVLVLKPDAHLLVEALYAWLAWFKGWAYGLFGVSST